MKNYLWLVVVGLLSLASAAPLAAQESPGQFGVGAYIGVPFGFSAKYLIDRTAAIDMALGAQGDNIDFHADALIHFRDIQGQPPACRIAPYVGMGLKIEGQDETLFGVRFVGGVAFIPRNTPLEIFGEIAPVLRMAPSVGSNLDGGVGLRFYFGGSGYSSSDRTHRIRQ